jgi:hypothetical protein
VFLLLEAGLGDRAGRTGSFPVPVGSDAKTGRRYWTVQGHSVKDIFLLGLSIGSSWTSAQFEFA